MTPCHLCGDDWDLCGCWETVEEWEIPDAVINGEYELKEAFNAAFEKAVLGSTEH